MNTGITRRIDELGRIVIPKEIRNNLKIRNNEELDINTSDSKIILTKHEVLNKDNTINTFVKTLGKYLNKNIIFTSRDKVISYYTINKEKINEELDENIILLIEKRKEIKNTKITINDANLIYVLNPIIINGDLIGSLIMYSLDNISENDEKMLKFSTMFFEKYLE